MPVTMHPLREADARASADALLAQLDEEGYLFFRGLLDRESVLGVRSALLAVLDRHGWLAAGRDRDEALPSASAVREEADAKPEFFRAYAAVQAEQSFHELAHHPALRSLMESLLGSPLLVHPRKIARVGLPRDDFVAPPHQDFPLVQGTPDTLTAWIPVGDCPDDLGGLRVLPGSHRQGFRKVRANRKVGGLEVDEDLDGDPTWATADFGAGDVLVFHSLTVHGAKRSNSDRLRLSVDFRYQSAADVVVAESLGPHYHPQVPAFDMLTTGWSSTEAIGAPEGVQVTPMFDPFSGPDAPVRSRLVRLGG